MQKREKDLLPSFVNVEEITKLNYSDCSLFMSLIEFHLLQLQKVKAVTYSFIESYIN